MVHLSEKLKKIPIRILELNERNSLNQIQLQNNTGVHIVVLPVIKDNNPITFDNYGKNISNQLDKNSILITVGDSLNLIYANESMSNNLTYQGWIAIKRDEAIINNPNTLPNQHFGALIHSKYRGQLKHTKTRIKYSYCPTCDKTTKDYGGKKHTYHPEGTLISDVWRDVSFNYNGDLSGLFHRFSDLFGLKSYAALTVYDLRNSNLDTKSVIKEDMSTISINRLPANLIIKGDCLDKLSKIPSNSVEFVFVDPPYNLKKKYSGYKDDLKIKDYFMWCDNWITELSRVLKPGCTLALLNIPLWSIRHALYMNKSLVFQNWIVWDALSFPVRMIMPAHYSILCFSKGTPRKLPYLEDNISTIDIKNRIKEYEFLPLQEGYCLRSSCKWTRKKKKINDRGPLTDVIWDIHRLKHNNRRVDHPTQLPPELLYRLISIFTYKNETVLDCFNGAGTTSLCAEQTGRNYIGIEKSNKYVKLAKSRHLEISRGLDPFRKVERRLTAKNSPVKRMPKRNYEVPKRELQLEIRRISKIIGKIPSKDEVRLHTKYPFNYFEEYFISWGEACAAARTTGMSEIRLNTDTTKKKMNVLLQN